MSIAPPPPSNGAPDSALRATTLLLSIGALVVCWPVWPALVLATWTVAIAQPLFTRTERLLRGRRTVASALLSATLLVLFGGPLLLTVLGVWSGGRELTEAILAATTAQGVFVTLSSGTAAGAAAPDGASSTGALSELLRMPASIDDVLALAQRYGSQAYGLATTIAGAAWRVGVSLIVYFAAVFFLFIDGASAWRWIEERSPLAKGQLARLADAFQETGRGLLLGVGLTCATQGIVATVVYASLGVPRAWVLGPITGVAAILPVLGTTLVWGPLAIAFFVTGSPIKGVLLVVLGVGLISVVDNFLRPLFARLGSLKMPILLVFISLFGGLTTFGTWGAILGPLLVRLAMEALALRKEALGDVASSPTPPAPQQDEKA